MAQEGILRKFPTPETCVELDWKGETMFYWRAYETPKGIQYALFIKYLHWYNLVFANFDNEFCKSIGEYIPAPQMDDIAPFLPDFFDYRKIGYTYAGGSDYWKASLRTTFDTFTQPKIEYGNACMMLGYYHSLVENNKIIWVEIKKHCYTQAYAELYLQLKKNNLLPS